MVVLVGLLAFLTSYTQGKSMNCSKYICSTQRFEYPSNCMVYSSLQNTYYVNPCEHGYFCDVTKNSDSANCTYKQPYVPSNKLPGESCNYDIDCYKSNSCVDGKCVGKQLNQECQKNQDCDVGLYCFNQKCQQQIKENGVGCLKDADCTNDCGCENFDQNKTKTNVCKKYFSVPNYEVLQQNCGKGYVDYLCESGFCVDVGVSMCYPAPISNHSLPVKCSGNSDCTSSPAGQSGVIVQGKCSCGFNAQGQSYCEQFAGDPVQTKFAEKVREWVRSEGILKCNTEARFGENCMKEYWSEEDTYELYYYLWYSFQYAYSVDAPDCLREVYLPHLYGYSQKVNEDSAVYLQVFLAALIF